MWDAVKKAALIAELITAFAVIWTAVWWFATIHERRAEAVSVAWQAINSARDPTGASGGSGGRIEALERLAQEGVSLRGLAVPKAYLERIDLSASDLEASVFTGARLTKAVFQDARLNYGVFNDAHLQFAQFNGSKARYARFEAAFLNDADFTASTDAQCTTPAIPTPSPGRVTNFGPDDYDEAWRTAPKVYSPGEYVDTRIEHDGTNLFAASFDRASLRQAKFCGSYLYEARFNGVDASGAKFNGVAARYASFRGAVLESVDFRGADLTHADFTDACLLGANFSAAKLGGATFDGARIGFDPNPIKTTFDAGSSDEPVRAFASVLERLTYQPKAFRDFIHDVKRFSPRSASAAGDAKRSHGKVVLIGYDVSRHGNRLLENWLRLEGDPGEQPPSCPVPVGVPLPQDNIGEH